MPRYLAVLAYGTFWLLIVIVTAMFSKRLLVKLICTDLDSLSWMEIYMSKQIKLTVVVLLK